MSAPKAPPRHTGALPAVLAVWGLLYACIGLTWALAPTPGRLAALDAIPVEVTEVHVGWAWMLGGAVTAAGGAVGLHRISTRMVPVATGVGILTPLLAALPFWVGWLTGYNPRGGVTVVSYTAWAAALLAVAVIDSRISAARARHHPPHPTGAGDSE